MTKQNPLNIHVGDTVRIHLTHHLDLSPFLAKVTRVVGRHTSDLIGFDPIDPTDDEYFTNPIAPHVCDVGYVVEIVKRAPYQSPQRPVNKKLFPLEYHFCENRHHLYFCEEAIMAILENKGIFLEYGLKGNFAHLWVKAGRPGLSTFTPQSEFHRGAKVVNRKAFTNWVLCAVNKIARSKSEWIRDELFLENEEYEDWNKEELNNEREELRYEREGTEFEDKGYAYEEF
jgi:hypothetical protein